MSSKYAFCKGNDVYKKYDNNYKKHKKGYVILGPPGIGKSTFIKSQISEKRNWIDQDELFKDLGVDWKYNKNNYEDFKLNYLRADYMSEQSRVLGYRLIGSLSLLKNFKADAIVIPLIKNHSNYIQKRKDLHLSDIKDIRKIYKNYAKTQNIKIFYSIIDAVNYLENK